MTERAEEIKREHFFFTECFGQPIVVLPKGEMEQLCEYAAKLEAENADLKTGFVVHRRDGYMTLCEILKDMGASDERIRRKGWVNKWLSIDHDSDRLFDHVAGRDFSFPWHPMLEDLEADDWEYWSMPDAASL